MNRHLGEKKEYQLFYTYRNLGFKDPVLSKDPILSISTAIILKTEIPKERIFLVGIKIFFFSAFKSGSSYLIKIKFGNIIKTYLLDSGASDMTLDAETYQYLKGINQLKIGNNLTVENIY